jgi:hypothetical protein
VRHFSIKELVDKATYAKYGESSVWFIDSSLQDLIDTLRDLFGCSITVNNWPWGGSDEYRGLRIVGSPHHSTYSQHSFGRAVDFDVKGHTAEEARLKIKKWYREGKLGDLDISLEEQVTWVHLDVRSTGIGLDTFKP